MEIGITNLALSNEKKKITIFLMHEERWLLLSCSTFADHQILSYEYTFNNVVVFVYNLD